MRQALLVSLKNDANTDEFFRRLETLVTQQLQQVVSPEEGDRVLVTRQRHRELLEQTLAHLQNF